MAIQFARARYISRCSGGSAVRSAAYNAREAIQAERTGEVFHFRHRDAPEHHEVLLPEGAAPRFAEAGALWNAAEAAERRKDAQVAREIVLALPADAEVFNEDRIALARSFAEQHFVAKGLAVQLDVHAPHGAEAESERANWHAHLLITTRRLEGEQFNAKKARDLDPEVRQAGGRARVADGAAWGELWREHQDAYFREHGLAARVDATATHAQEHIGPVRMRRAGSEIVERAETIRQANQEAARDPAQVLAALTRNNATFTERDLDRFLSKQLGEEGRDATKEIAAVRAAVLNSRDLAPLHDRETGEAAGRFTTRQVREEERAAMAAAGGLARGRSGAVSERSAQAATAERTLRPDQAAAFTHAIGAGNLKLIEGRAGTGKSYTLAAIRDAHERDGKRVVGLAPTNAVAQDLAADGFREAGTVHAALFKLKNGRTSWDRSTVVVVDEAAMLDTKVTGELLAAARQAGAKVVLAGDDRQLASIERGGLFAELRQRHGAAEITEVTRQKVDWQRQAARDLAEGRFAEAVGAFDTAGAITWTQDQADAQRALVAVWRRDGEARPGQSRFVFAYTNRDVNALNAELREVRRERGELAGGDVQLDTKHGTAAFAVGDRVQFTATDKKRHIYNGNVGTITGLDAHTGQITATLDPAGGTGRQVAWPAAEFEGFRHGYTGTIYKGQGKTLDHTYLLHTHHWRAAASYVALTRQRESAQVFVAEETARDVHQLARQMARGEVRAASVAWATADELRPELRQRDRDAQQAPKPARQDEAPAARAGQRDPAREYWGRTAAAGVADPLPPATPAKPDREKAGAGQGTRAETWLIPPFVSPDGKDSLGRGLDSGSVAAAIAANGAVQREREARWSYLQGAYRDSYSARAALDELVKREGWTSVAARLAREPEQLGELRGKVGWLASAAAKQERAGAERAASALPGSLERIGEAESRAERGYRANVEAQRTADVTGIPRLSAAAEAVIGAMRAAPDEKARGEAWRSVQASERVAGELRAFSAAVEQRFGEEGVRAMLRAGGRPGAVTAPSVKPEQRPELDRVAELTTALKLGERAGASLAQREAESQRQGQRRGMRM